MAAIPDLRVRIFIDDAKLKALDEFEFALQKISRLPLWARWRAKAIAQQALGTGPYWDQGWVTHPWYVRLWRRLKDC